MQKLQVLYEQMIQDDELMQERKNYQLLHQSYETNHPERNRESGFVENKLTISPVGLIPLDINEGYFFFSSSNTKSTRVYQYRLSFFEKHDEKNTGNQNFLCRCDAARFYQHLRTHKV